MQTKSVFLLLLFFLPVPALIAGGVQPYDLRLEHLTNPAGIDELKPRFSWKLKSNENGQSQSAYQITVRKRNKTMESNGLTYTVIPSDDGRTLTETVWETGKVQSSSQFVEYGGQTL
jgi:hypothetical protein